MQGPEGGYTGPKQLGGRQRLVCCFIPRILYLPASARVLTQHAGGQLEGCGEQTLCGEHTLLSGPPHLQAAIRPAHKACVTLGYFLTVGQRALAPAHYAIVCGAHARSACRLIYDRCLFHLERDGGKGWEEVGGERRGEVTATWIELCMQAATSESMHACIHSVRLVTQACALKGQRSTAWDIIKCDQFGPG